jgi:hypothetical protein
MTNQTTPPSPAPDQYEPPRIEQVLGPDELEREVHYAGTISGPVG